MAAQRYFHARADCDSKHERYISPNGEFVLELELKEELRFGPKLFSATVNSAKGDRPPWKIKSSLFISPGCLGRGYDHWSGEPWNHDSSRVVLFEFSSKGGEGKGKGSFFDLEQQGRREIATASGQLSHHMWSPQSRYYMFRDQRHWHIFDLARSESRVLATLNDYPRHCYFTSDDQILLLEDSLKLISTESLKILDEQPWAHSSQRQTDRYSFYDPIERRVLIGFKVSIGQFISAREWNSIEVI